jgi:hypothetical protein
MIDNPIVISQQIWGYPLYALMGLAVVVMLRVQVMLLSLWLFC